MDNFWNEDSLSFLNPYQSIYDKYDYKPFSASKNDWDYKMFSQDNIKQNMQNPFLQNTTPKTQESFFASKGFANAMTGIGMAGSVLGGIGGIMAAREQKKFNKKVLALEEQQRNRIMAREDANNKALNQGINAFFSQKKDNL